jgi:hypothetical protein
MAEKISALADRLGKFTQKNSEGTVAIWGHILGRSDGDVVLRIGESNYRIKEQHVREVQEIEPVGQKGEGVEVFLLVDDQFELRTSAKDVARLTGGATHEGETPFALARPDRAASPEYTNAEMEQSNNRLNEWRKKLGLFQKFAKALDQCTLINTQQWTSAGIGDVGHIFDGNIGDGCDGH